jgi:FixJ family two-component response regulator
MIMNASPSDAAAPTVLVVDDDPDVLGSLRFSLEVEGYRVRTYADGAAILSDPLLPDSGCLVVDFHIPGNDGLAVIDSLRARRVAMPAILITSAPPAAVVRRAAAAGVPIVEKPLLGSTLSDGIRKALTAASV